MPQQQPARGPYDIKPRTFTRPPAVATQVAEQQRESERGVAAQAIVVPSKKGILEPAAGGHLTTEGSIAWYDYHTGKPQRAKVVTPPKDGILDLTVCLSLSGHVGRQTLERWQGYSGFLYAQGLLVDGDGKPLTSPPDYAALFTNDYLP